jgi:hypothetical protein
MGGERREQEGALQWGQAEWRRGKGMGKGRLDANFLHTSYTQTNESRKTTTQHPVFRLITIETVT